MKVDPAISVWELVSFSGWESAFPSHGWGLACPSRDGALALPSWGSGWPWLLGVRVLALPSRGLGFAFARLSLVMVGPSFLV